MERQKGAIARFGLVVEDTVLCASEEKSTSLNKKASIRLSNEVEVNNVIVKNSIKDLYLVILDFLYFMRNEFFLEKNDALVLWSNYHRNFILSKLPLMETQSTQLSGT